MTSGIIIPCTHTFPESYYWLKQESPLHAVLVISDVGSTAVTGRLKYKHGSPEIEVCFSVNESRANKADLGSAGTPDSF